MNKKTCFIICPISTEGSDIRKRSDQLLKHIIEPVVSTFDYEIIRVDKVEHNESITQKILNYLETADLVISDITGHNPNCFYETGYRTALRKEIIFIKDIAEKIPFDIVTIRTLEYDLNDLDAVEKIKNSLKETISNIPTKKISNSTQHNEVENNNLDRELLYKILNTLLNLDNKIDKFNADTISALADKLVVNSRPKNENEVMIEFFKEVMKNPESLKTLTSLGMFGNKK